VYETFYGLETKPFRMTPDPRFLFQSKSHREALAILRYGILDNKGFVVLVGEVGTGKTLLLHSLISSLPEGTDAAYLFCPQMDFRDLLRYLLSEFHREAPQALSDGELLIHLNDYLTERLAEGKRNVLIIDEAQNMDDALLESIRMLSNLETAETKLLQIVLAGQPELEVKLNRPELRQLRQRVSLKAVIDPLDRGETREYIRYRLEVAGCGEKIPFSDSAIDLIHEYGRGIPRTVNIIADNALVLGYAADERDVGRHLVGEAIRDLEKETPRVAVQRSTDAVSARRILAACAALLAISLAVYGVIRWREQGYAGFPLYSHSSTPFTGPATNKFRSDRSEEKLASAELIGSQSPPGGALTETPPPPQPTSVGKILKLEGATATVSLTPPAPITEPESSNDNVRKAVAGADPQPLKPPAPVPDQPQPEIVAHTQIKENPESPSSEETDPPRAQNPTTQQQEISPAEPEHEDDLGGTAPAITTGETQAPPPTGDLVHADESSPPPVQVTLPPQKIHLVYAPPVWRLKLDGEEPDAASWGGNP
jgi:type II secretory pathway predicted ATPase ExeA